MAVSTSKTVSVAIDIKLNPVWSGKHHLLDGLTGLIAIGIAYRLSLSLSAEHDWKQPER